MYYDRDIYYAEIIRTKNRKEMYKYKLIKGIVNDLDNYLKENKINSINDEAILLSLIISSNRKHISVLRPYFKIIGYNPRYYKDIDTIDIEKWLSKYNWHHQLYLDDNYNLIYC